MTKSLILAALVASFAVAPGLAAAKGGHHSYKAPKAPKAETTKVETTKVEKTKTPKKA